ncbi:MAG: tyrosine-type recombinase/integrase [Proteobacteria bacterium]|nr:tyrosine-type recombinase/integrase [Pseudomonadota bacterium]
MRKQLSDAACRSARPKSKPYKLTDRDGLSLLVKPVSQRNPKGIKLWRFRYKFHGRDTLLSLGRYPDVNLSEARELVMAERRLLGKGEDPSVARKEKQREKLSSFGAVAQDFFRRGCPYGSNQNLKPITVELLRQRYNDHLKPSLGSLPIADITVADLSPILDRIAQAGHLETAHRIRALAERIFRLAVVHELTDNNPALALRGTIPARVTRQYAAITKPEQIGPLLRAIEDYDGQPEVCAALRLAPHVFVRPGELRGALWAEIDWDNEEWVIPGERMKMNREHVVPLSKQAVAILKELQPVSGDFDLIFPGLRSRERPISDNTLNAALRRLGYTKDQMTTHGFRSTASTRLHEMRKGDKPMFDSAVIETQLAHVDSNAIRAIYNRFDSRKYITARRKMMQYWSDYLDRLKSEKSTVVELKTG